MSLLRTIAALAAMLALSISGALAHAVLTESIPRDGSRLERSPAEIVLRFSEPVSLVRMQLTGSGNLPPPELRGVATANNAITVPIPDRMEQGSYILSYSVTSVDGHPVTGSIAFGIGQETTAVPAPQPNQLDWLMALNRAAHYAFLLAATGGSLFLLLVLRRQQVPPLLPHGLLAFTGVAAATLVLSIGLAGLQLAALPLRSLLSAEPWAAGAATSLLASTIAGLAGLLFIAAGLAKRASTLGKAAMGGGCLLALLSLPLTGHAATAPPSWVSAPAVYLHGFAAAFWAGSLWPLWILLDRMAADDGVRMVRRFSSLAIGLVSALIAAGAFLSIAQIGGVGAMLATPYGWIWVIKIGLVVPLVGLAAFNRQVLLPNLASGGPALLRRSIIAEALLLTAILLATSLLGQTPPPRAWGAQEHGDGSGPSVGGEPAVPDLESNDYRARVALEPALAGTNRITVRVRDAQGNSVAALQDITAVWSLPSAGIEGLARQLPMSSDGNYSGTIELPVAGTWIVQVEVLVSDFEKVVFRTEVKISER